MGIFSKFENKMEDTFEGAAGVMSNSPIAPVQIFKKAEKQMKRGIMVGAGKEFSPTLYTVLINGDDDRRMFGYYPTLAGEAETYLKTKAVQAGLIMDGDPLVRFVVDDGLRSGKFDVIAEMVAAPIVAQLRQEEMVRYGLADPAAGAAVPQAYASSQPYANDAWAGYAQGAVSNQSAHHISAANNQGVLAANNQEAPANNQEAPAKNQEEPAKKPPLPYVPEDEIDRSIDYGEYTFNSEDFEDYRKKASEPLPDDSVAKKEDAFATYNETSAQANNYADIGVSEDAWGQNEALQQPYHNDLAAHNTVVHTQGQGGPAPANAVVSPQTVQARVIDVAYRRAYDLAGSHITIGRESSNDITVQDINASRRHAELRLTSQGVWTVTDLGSTNGTMVNGRRVATQPLRAGDIVTIGKTDLEFTLL